VSSTYQIGLVYRQLGDYRRAISELRTPVDTLVGELLHDRFSSPAVLSVHARAWMATALAEVGQFTEGITLAEEAVQIAADAKSAFSQTNAHVCLGTVHLRHGSVDRAIPILKTSVTLCRDGNYDLLLPHTASALGEARILAGRVEEALPLLEQAIETAAVKGLRGGESRSTWAAWGGECSPHAEPRTPTKWLTGPSTPQGRTESAATRRGHYALTSPRTTRSAPGATRVNGPAHMQVQAKAIPSGASNVTSTVKRRRRFIAQLDRRAAPRFPARQIPGCR
jgi:tetratricopeptide (TPR) repeat protein